MRRKKDDAPSGERTFFNEGNWYLFTLLELDLERLKDHVDEEGKNVLAEINCYVMPAVHQFFKLYRKYGELISIEDPSHSVFFPEDGPAVRTVGKKLRISKKRQVELMKHYNVWRSCPVDEKPELVGKKKGGE